MTRKEWIDYLRDLADRMQLTDWEVELDERGPQVDGALMTATCTQETCKVVIAIDPVVNIKDRGTQRELAVHELIHVILDGMATATAKLDTLLGAAAYEYFEKVFEWKLEQATYTLASVLAPSMPLPPKPKAKKKRRA